ncbi:glycosyltransferase family 4 protein [Polynucleobacter sp. 15G-AUS-farblos]|uniref:glycosyltransferase family 4 protein n=1 Tax=Polynucleobacter sp. 15G-AUS-farblos TaxID=2689094 RepID=UPI001C0B902A|nr:glycosyltransferase family 4 protein [Polynucleobacter sp. 15G-AUS-farblos]MBU3584090.1 glycosyltransferase family 4 protein [Polynucleobacter sp. 15G-AUS-farblos]
MKPIRKKILFFAWGYSIHAFRRISIFAEDKNFDVAIISNYRYQIQNTQLFFLDSTYLLFVEKLIALALFGLVLVPLIFFKIKPNEVLNSIYDLILARKYVNSYGADIIFLQTLIYPNYLALFLRKKIPLAITFWNGDVIWWAKWTGLERAFKKIIVKNGVKNASLITVNSSEAYGCCMAYGADEKKIELIRYPGVDREKFYPGNKSREAAQFYEDGGRVVFCPRGIGEYLNSENIIRSIPSVLKEFPKIKFIFLYGAESHRLWDEHLKLAESLGVGLNVVGMSKIEWTLMPNMYRDADVMVSISSNDSLPNCMMEAMACGVPIVMGGIPSIQEWVLDGVNGFCVDPKNSVQLAERIIQTLRGQGVVSGFAKYNLSLVANKFDSADNIKKIKDAILSRAL